MGRNALVVIYDGVLIVLHTRRSAVNQLYMQKCVITKCVGRSVSFFFARVNGLGVNALCPRDFRGDCFRELVKMAYLYLHPILDNRLFWEKRLGGPNRSRSTPPNCADIFRCGFNNYHIALILFSRPQSIIIIIIIL